MHPVLSLGYIAVLLVAGYAYGVLTPTERAALIGPSAPPATSRPAALTVPPVSAVPPTLAARDAEAPVPAPKVGVTRKPPPAADAAPRGVEDLRAAATAGDTEATFDLAKAYDEGDGIEEDDAEAARWYQIAADKGHPAAQNDLGFLYETGQGVETDFEAAARWYRRAGENGLAVAQTNLGLLYENGRGVQRDGAEAARWYLRAARQDSVDAQFNLALLHERGLGVPQSDAEALKWYRQAARSGTAETNNALAWFLATTRNEALRDGKAAEAAAKIAVAAEPDNANYLDTLAAAHAQAGDFERAVATQASAVERARQTGDAAAVQDFSNRLALYRDRQPARQ